jgi:uncharacterized protein (UPF0276 family)
VLAEDVSEQGELPASLALLRDRGVAIAVHSVSVSLGSADGLDERALHHLAAVCARLGATVASEHVCFVRAGGLESGHLLPLPFTAEARDVLVENLALAKRTLPVPLAVENVAALVEWPGAEWSEGRFLREVLERADCALLLDLSNLFANAKNFGGDPRQVLAELPLERVAYVHVAGGVQRGRHYFDTHAHPLPLEVLPLVKHVRERGCLAGLLLERDDRFPPADELEAELRALEEASRG